MRPTSPESRWWRHYFDEAYFTLHGPLFDEQRSRREVAAMRELLALPVGARVLDAPCGWGRHTHLFADAQLNAFGADLSFDMLRHAPRSATPDSAAAATYVAADVRALPFRDHTFDAVLNVYTSLGLFLDDAEDVRALAEARRVLRPNGVFLLESMHRDDVIAQYAERDRWTLPDGTEIRVRRRFDPVTGISRERMRWRAPDSVAENGSDERPWSGEKRHALKLRTATEIDGLLQSAGFHDIAWFGDWNGAPLRHDSEHVIAVARGVPRS